MGEELTSHNIGIPGKLDLDLAIPIAVVILAPLNLGVDLKEAWTIHRRFRKDLILEWLGMSIGSSHVITDGTRPGETSLAILEATNDSELGLAAAAMLGGWDGDASRAALMATPALKVGLEVEGPLTSLVISPLTPMTSPSPSVCTKMAAPSTPMPWRGSAVGI
eukprot:CAMPEP_0201966530 /NCGR_PEP_ID=MMETSP0904-20121228/11477_1 /ASSEMBLY_ACC=CAM_ASM_000553 /TAXON_ID=420261 /ORGANISM="Thalassiosira antarctica, Strain CCMP982" /LENGTH=163 /DNA_ID=CAMNT_0048513789 /DNA_START=959 /DNA_END=1452 /DNA_ORIENTATION=-